MLLIAAIHTKGQLLIASWLPLLVFIAVPAALSWKSRTLDNGPRPPLAPRWRPMIVLFAVFLALLFSSATRHKWFFMLGWAPESATFSRTGMGRFLLLAVLLLSFCVRRTRWQVTFLWLLLFTTQILCAIALWRGTNGGAPLWRDDHPSFLFRLYEASQIFPRLQSYNPYWNGGGVHSVGVTSGIAGPFLLAAPLWLAAPVHRVYTAGVIWLFIFAVPWITAVGLRAMGGSRTAMALAGLLALGVSQHFFMWMLHFGTIGASLSAAMLPAVAAWSYRAVHLRRFGWFSGASLVAATLMLLFWPPAALYGVGLILSLVLSFRRWSWRLFGYFAACGAIVFLIWLPWLAVLLGDAEGTVDYVMERGPGTAASTQTLGAVVVAGATHLKYHLLEANPLLLVFGLLGTFTAAPGRVRRWVGPALLWLAFLTGWGRDLWPRLQLGRTAIPLMFLAILPAALVLSRLWHSAEPRLATARAGVLAFLIAGAWNVTKIYAGRGLTPYNALGEPVMALAEWIRQNTPPNARVCFAGRTVHAYGRGHIAYLPILTGREMLACDYYHFPTDLVEYEYPPRPWREDAKGIQEFCELYNISAFITYHEHWKAFFRDHPELFEPGFSQGDIAGFHVKRVPRPILGASGRTWAGFNRLEVELYEDAAEILLPYNWEKGLKAIDGIELFPAPQAGDVVLIGVRPKGVRRFTIQWQPSALWPRLLTRKL